MWMQFCLPTSASGQSLWKSILNLREEDASIFTTASKISDMEMDFLKIELNAIYFSDL